MTSKSTRDTALHIEERERADEMDAFLEVTTAS